MYPYNDTFSNTSSFSLNTNDNSVTTKELPFCVLNMIESGRLLTFIKSTSSLYITISSSSTSILRSAILIVLALNS